MVAFLLNGGSVAKGKGQMTAERTEVKESTWSEPGVEAVWFF